MEIYAWRFMISESQLRKDEGISHNEKPESITINNSYMEDI